VPGDILEWNKTYYWHARAVNSLGVASLWSAYRTFKTAIGPPPNAPTGLSAAPFSSTRIDLHWTDNSGDETGFKIARKTGAGAYGTPVTVPAESESYSSTGLLANTTYTYKVWAYRGTTLSSLDSNEATATTLPPPPAAPTLLTPTSGFTVPTLTPTLDWSEPAGGVSWDVQVSEAYNFSTTKMEALGLPNSTVVVEAGAGLEWNKTYYWRANATNGSGSTSLWSAYRSFKTAIGPPPVAPTELSVAPLSSTSIKLYWLDNSNDETGFKIARKTGITYGTPVTVPADSKNYVSTGLLANTTYTYRVWAYRGTTLNSGYSNEVTSRTGPPPPTLTSPASGAINQSRMPLLNWSDSAGALTYGVLISETNTFNKVTGPDPDLDPPLLTSAWTVPEGKILLPNTLYYWKAIAYSEKLHPSTWSAVRTFRTGP
jgi:hypothetical protein